MMKSQDLTDHIIRVLDATKAKDLTVIKVSDRTSIADVMIIVTGTSERHVSSLATEVVDKVKAVGVQPLGVEGQMKSDWVLVDLGDVIVHVMTQKSRDFYELEKLWSVRPDGQSTEVKTYLQAAD